MGFLLLIKNFGLLFLLISASFLSTSLAGRQTKLQSESAAKEVHATYEETSMRSSEDHEDTEEIIHERLLKVNTKDYGRYDPAPALVRPPFKLIPN